MVQMADEPNCNAYHNLQTAAQLFVGGLGVEPQMQRTLPERGAATASRPGHRCSKGATGQRSTLAINDGPRFSR
jgi:hypothetical protein